MKLSEGLWGSGEWRPFSSHFFQARHQPPWASVVAQLVKNPPARQETLVQFLGGEVPLDKLPIPVFLGFPGGSGNLVNNLSAMQETWV